MRHTEEKLIFFFSYFSYVRSFQMWHAKKFSVIFISARFSLTISCCYCVCHGPMTLTTAKGFSYFFYFFCPTKLVILMSFIDSLLSCQHWHHHVHSSWVVTWQWLWNDLRGGYWIRRKHKEHDFQHVFGSNVWQKARKKLKETEWVVKEKWKQIETFENAIFFLKLN